MNQSNSQKLVFPEGTIVLKNGTVLPCYPIDNQPSEAVDSGFALDTTGEFLTARRHPSAQPATPEEEAARRKRDEEIFLQNAFLFYRNADRIMSDSRMFLSPLPFRNNLAYSGRSGLRNPTLGIYLEWWHYCTTDLTHDRRRQEALTYFIAGSPLSGDNRCQRVYPDGHTEPAGYSPFIPVWTSLGGICSRYRDAVTRYQAYTLEEVVAILKATEEIADK